jgi:outer membrane protein assembly factor BamB
MQRSSAISRLLLATAVSWPLLAGGPATAQNWTRYRGDNGSGISSQKGIPVTFSPGDYKWKITLPGEGHSSPVIWKDKLFVTSAVDRGALRYLHCINTDSGKVLWTRETGLNRSPKHNKSSWASATPTVDDERVYAAFGDKETNYLAAYTHDGDVVWRKNLGPFDSQHGQGVSPVLFEDLIIFANDQDGPSSIVALDKRSGRTVWSTLRSIRRASYATPMIFREAGKRPQLICASGAMGLTSLDPYTGRLNWMTGEFPLRTVASPVLANGLLIQSCGGAGKGKLLIAVDPHESAAGAKTRITYQREKTLPYVPTPIAYKGHVYLWNDDGVVSCIVAKTGRNVWTRRVGGGYSGSPICIDGKIYIMSEKGEVVVIAASPEFKLLGRTPLEDRSHATPAVAHGRLYLRTFHHLICLEAQR